MRIDEQKVSIIIPTYFRNKLLAEALMSAKCQKYSNIEIIVVDDSGEGFAAPVIDQFNSIEYMQLNSNLGANKAREKGVQRASGDYIQFLDDDDLILPSKISKQIRSLNKNDTGVCYCGSFSNSQDATLPINENQGDVLNAALQFNLNPCQTATMLIDNQALYHVLPLRERGGADDLSLMIKLASYTEFSYIDEALVHRRTDDGTYSRGAQVEAALARQRIITEMSDIYEQAPNHVKKGAMYEGYRSEGEIRLKKNIYSFRAIYAFFNLIKYSDHKLKDTIKFISSLFGRPGWKIYKDAGRVLTTDS